MKKSTLLILFLFIATVSYAQPYYFRHYQVENGLSNNSVFCSAQDNEGFMWFGTKDGLNRFDGYQFKTYRYNAEQPGSLGNDLVYALHQDNSNRLWVGTNRGVYLYLPKTEKFQLIKGTEDLRINSLATDDNGNLWIISIRKTFVYNINQKRLNTLDKLTHFDATSVSKMDDGSIWITTLNGTIEQYDAKLKRFNSYYVMSKANPKENSWVTKTIDMGNGNILIGTANQGIKSFNRRNGLIKEILTFNSNKTSIYVRDIIKSSEDEFWIASESGIYVLRNDKIVQLTKQYSNLYSLSDNAIYTLHKDKEHGIWAGTYFGGINYCSSQYSVFTKYFPQKGINSIAGSDVREIHKDGNGNFWIGTEDAGLSMLNPKTGLFTNFFPDGKSSSISYSNIHGLLVDGNKLWIGTFEHGIDVMDITTKKVIKHYTPGKGNSLLNGFILTFCKTRSGDIYLATIVGLYKYNKEKDDFDLVEGLPLIFYAIITEDSNGNIWAGSFNHGVVVFTPGKKGYTQYQNNPKNSKSISHNTINGICEDSSKNIWISTDGGGLNLFNRKNKSFNQFTVKDGLPSNFLFKIVEDSEKKLWIGTSRGLLHFNPDDESIKVYSSSNGLLTDQFNYNSGFKDTDGRIYFGSVRGMISFNPAELNITSKQPPIKITGFQINNQEIDVFGKSVLSESILNTNKIVLNDAQSSFSFDFAAISFLSPEMTQYAYRMKGISDEWNYLKTNRKVYFTKLSAGDYVFEIKALANCNTTWTKTNPKLLITVMPPFYKSNIAYSCYTILLGLIIFYFFKAYHLKMENRNKRRMEHFENKKEKEIYQAKIEFFTNIAHEIRTPLTLIKGPMGDLLKQASEVPYMEKKLKIMERNTDRLFKLTNQLLDFRKTEVNGFSLNFVKADISEILTDIFTFFQTITEQKNLDYKLVLPTQNLEAYIDTEAFYKILSNLIDNAIKYSDSIIEVSLKIPEGVSDHFEITVLNDGRTIPEELHQKIFEPFFRATETQIKQGTGIGLSLSKSLTELHGGNLTVINDEAGNNLFVLVLPIHQLIEFNLKGKWKKRL
ncbi:two-component regulator propeller domain-containing protein [Pedobacter aquatilis]|uniref:ligand-binding sensor domain-containing protein n=1 Tax=Pedobacter aquatilis TaxID=351343 RepID=UPI0025B51C0F|nr:sensor histidine kinase [Pedobacter aquatilis]MDN3588282.1 two-component regulator propeller domain-containing protein [Pedobacter aquatilis]